jgi:hypothetical protein
VHWASFFVGFGCGALGTLVLGGCYLLYVFAQGMRDD